jgi:hypothetical protein
VWDVHFSSRYDLMVMVRVRARVRVNVNVRVRVSVRVRVDIFPPVFFFFRWYQARFRGRCRGCKPEGIPSIVLIYRPGVLGLLSGLGLRLFTGLVPCF